MLPRKIQNEILKYPKFYQKVWRVTCTIPAGQTKSYSWVAQQIGNPRAVRAVGQALKANPYPGIIPCHRVICKDGSLGGYSRGLNEKIKLLNREKIKITKILNKQRRKNLRLCQ